MGRPRKIVTSIQEQAQIIASKPDEQIEEGILNTNQDKPIINNESEIVLVKTINRYIVAQLIELDKKVIVKHISGTGQNKDPKNWYIEVSIGTLNKLSQENQNELLPATYLEIEQRIGKSKIIKEKEKIESGAQKRKPGESPVASANY